MAVQITAGSGTSVRTITPATDHQQVVTLADALGNLSDPSASWDAAINPTTATTTSLKAAAGAGIRNYLRTLSISNAAATANLVSLTDGTNVRFRFQLPATIGSATAVSFDPPLRGPANAAWSIITSAAASVHVAAAGYTGT